MLPQTPFEARGAVAPWTTLEEEGTYLEALVAAAPRLSMRVLGTSVEGRPIRAVRIGTGPRHIVHVSEQHGNEPCTRDAWLSILRDWAGRTDADFLDYLQRVTIHVIPTANPDRFDQGRNNASNVDLNRDHVKLTQPETQAIHTLLRDTFPDVVVDWHESDGANADHTSVPSTNTNAGAEVTALGEGLHTSVRDAITASGSVAGRYGRITGPNFLIGYASIRNMVSLISETEMDMGQTADAPQRHARNLTAAEAIWRWHWARVDTVASTVTSARSRRRENREPIMLQNGQDATGPVIIPLPTGYRLTEAEWDAIAVHRDLQGVTGTVADDGAVVPMEQDAQTLVAYLMDPLSPERMVTGVPDGLPVPIPRIPPGGYTLKYRHNGVTYPATLKVKP